MNDGSLPVFLWPELPPLPPRGQPVLVRMAVPSLRSAARLAVREALRHVFSAWSGLPADRLPLDETPRGPVWTGQLGGASLDISLSYGEDESWIGLIRDGSIGVDVMRPAPFAEMEQVARVFLDPVTVADSPQAFAAAWTEREARLKCLKRGLVDWTPAAGEEEARCACRRVSFGDMLMGAVSWIGATGSTFAANV